MKKWQLWIIQRVIVDAADEAGDVAAPFRAYDMARRGPRHEEEGHQAISVLVRVLGDEGFYWWGRRPASWSPGITITSASIHIKTPYSYSNAGSRSEVAIEGIEEHNQRIILPPHPPPPPSVHCSTDFQRLLIFTRKDLAIKKKENWVF